MLLQQTVAPRSPTLFGKLRREQVSPRLPFREPELEWLGQRLESYLCSREDRLALFVGGPGSGKTAISKLATRVLAALQPGGNRKICVASINHPLPLTLHGLLSEMLRYVCPFRPTEGISDSRLMELLGATLADNDLRLIVVADTIRLGPKAYGVLRHFVEANRELRSRPVCLVIGARAAETERGFDLLRLRPYTRQEIWELLDYRLSLSSSRHLAADDALEHVASRASMDGDFGYAIDTIGLAIRLALSEGQPKARLEHVLEADKKYVDPAVASAIRTLSLHEKLLLYSVFGAAGIYGEPSIGEVEAGYTELCSHIGIRPRGHTQVWSYIQTLRELGLVDTSLGGKNGRGRTTKIRLPPQLFSAHGELKRQIKKHVVRFQPRWLIEQNNP